MTAPLWTAEAIAAATGGTASAPFSVGGVAFDSREIIGGELFIALKGETTDGHRFIPTALERGAAGLLVSEAVAAPHVRVADTSAASSVSPAVSAKPASRKRCAPRSTVSQPDTPMPRSNRTTTTPACR